MLFYFHCYIFFYQYFTKCVPLITVVLRCEQKYELWNPIFYFSFPHKRKLKLPTDDKGRKQHKSKLDF